MISIDEKIKRLKIGDTDVFLEDFEIGRGKITLSNSYGHNYSNFWGAMGSDISTFITETSPCYFAGKLLPPSDERVIDIKRTFRNVRAFIREELDMPYYREMEFQKDMRKKLNDFKNSCEEWGGKFRFVDSFHSDFTDELDFYLIDCKFDRAEIKANLEGISEVWYFLEEKESKNYEWLVSFHKLLVKELKKIK